ncbi:EMILIN-3 isoform X2 [Xenopus laevis]|nr:EMILIN-3 isoform X2 [Xenopus laevis]
MYIVEKNVTCTQQDGMEPYIKAEYLTCTWGPKCQGTVVYRTLYRPKYKIGYKVVTELEWRCCPGHTGDSCQDGSIPHSGFLPPYQGPKAGPAHRPLPPPKSPPTYNLQPKNGFGRKMATIFGERMDRVEEEVRRLSQSYESLQGVVTSLGDSLRLSIQEDTNKMIGSLINSPSSASQSSVEFGVIPDALAEAPHIPGDISGKVAEVSDILRTKTELLDEVNGMVMGHEAQLKHLLDAAKPSALTSTELLDQYLEGKLAESRAQLLEGIETRLQNIQGVCDVKVQTVKKECIDGEQAASYRIQQEMDGKEVEMRKEMSALNAKVIGFSAPEGCCGRIDGLIKRIEELERNMRQLTEDHHSLRQKLDVEIAQIMVEPQVNMRLDDVESRLNLTEEGIRRCCQEGGDNGHFLAELDGVKVSVDDKMRVLEERLITAVGELGNATIPLDGAVMPLLDAQISELRREGMEGMSVIQTRLTAVEELCATGCSVPGGESITDIHNEILQCREQGQDLRTQIDHLNNTILGIQRHLEIQKEEALQGEITLLQVNLRSVGRSLHGLEETVNKYADTVVQINTSAEERGSRLNEELVSVQGQVVGQGSQIRTSRTQLMGLRGDMERIKARLAGQMGTCHVIARDLKGEVSQVEHRLKQVEGSCHGQETSLLSYLDHINNTLASHEHDLVSLRHGKNSVNQQAPSLTLPPTTAATPGKK